MTSIHFEPLILPAVWIALALLAGAMLAWYARVRPLSVPRQRWAPIIVLMVVGTAAVLVILLNPTWLEPIPPPAGKPLLTVLVDRSASMAVEDASGAKSRYREAAEIAARANETLSGRFEVQVRTFGEGWAPTSTDELPSIKPDGRATDVAGALAGALAAERPQGQAVLIVSDGIHNAGGGFAAVQDVLRSAKAMDAPVYTTTIGGDTTLRDLEVVVGRPQELAFVGQQVPVSAVIRQRGRVTDRTDVALYKDGREVSRTTVALSPGASAPVRFQVNETASGLHRYEVRVPAHESEATAANNSAVFLLRVVEHPVRVLLLEGKPYWDAKFLVRTLSADPSVELDAVVRVAEGRFIKRSLRLPRDAAAKAAGETNQATDGSDAAAVARRVESTAILRDLAWLLDDEQGLPAYQLLVLGRDADAFLTEPVVERLRSWVARDGGSLVCFRGSPVATANQDLARVLPVRWAPSRETRFRVQLTERGQDLHWLGSAVAGEDDVFSRLPSLSASAMPESPKPLSVVLARAQQDPGPAVVTYQPYGTGRVVAVEGAGMWRWAFLAPQFQQHDQVYSALWQSLLRWLVSGVGLVPGQELMLRSDKVAWTAGEQVSAVLLMRPTAERRGTPSVELHRDGAPAAESFTPVPFGDEPGVYRVSFGALPEGSYRAKLIPAGGAATGSEEASAGTVAFDVRSFSGEQLDVAARPDEMARIASDTGGVVLPAGDPGALEKEFQQHLARSRPERIRRLTAWDRWWVLVGALVVWGTAWGLRRSAGLV